MLFLELYIGSGPTESYVAYTEVVELISRVDLTLSLSSTLEESSLRSSVDLGVSLQGKVYT